MANIVPMTIVSKKIHGESFGVAPVLTSPTALVRGRLNFQVLSRGFLSMSRMISLHCCPQPGAHDPEAVTVRRCCLARSSFERASLLSTIFPALVALNRLKQLVVWIHTPLSSLSHKLCVLTFKAP